MSETNSTSRLLTIIEYLNLSCGESEPVVIKKLLEYLHGKGFRTQRYTLLNDLKLLEKYEMGVCHVNRKYYYRKSGFSIEELMLLADAICYSNYIDVENTRKLINRLKELTSKKGGEKLQRQADVFVKPKSMNPLCISNAGKIHRAISDNRKISFGYLHYDKNRQLVPKENFKKTVSPYKLVWDNSQYYLVGVDGEKGQFLVSYRVDKLFDLLILDEERQRLKSTNKFYDPISKDIDIEKYMKSIFFMFGSAENALTRVELEVHESVIGAFIDKFGKDFSVFKINGEWLEIGIYIQLSSTFYGWLCQFGALIRLLTPSVKQKYLQHMEKIALEYDN